MRHAEAGAEVSAVAQEAPEIAPVTDPAAIADLPKEDAPVSAPAATAEASPVQPEPVQPSAQPSAAQPAPAVANDSAAPVTPAAPADMAIANGEADAAIIAPEGLAAAGPASGAAPEQPATLSDAGSDAAPLPGAAPEAAPRIAGTPQNETAGLVPPEALAALPEAGAQPAGPQSDSPASQPAAAGSPAEPAQDVPVLVEAPPPPPLTREEEILLAQMAADALIEETTPAETSPALPSEGDFVILDSLPTAPAAGEQVEEQTAEAQPAAPEAAPETVPQADPQTEPQLAEEAADDASDTAPALAEAGEPAITKETAPAADPAPAEVEAELSQPDSDIAAAEEIAPEVAPEAAPEIVPEAAPEQGVATESPAQSMPGQAKVITLEGGSSLPGTVPAARDTGVETNRLPRIGDSAAPAEGAGDLASAEPRIVFARTFENPAAKPRFSVILMDDGSADLDRQALADLPFAVSFAIDPQLPNAADIAATYRAAGQEVVMLTSGLPKGASASDVAVAFDAMAHALPEAVAAMDAPGRNFQADRPLSALVVPEISAQGRGLITWNVGLNAADQLAKREDVPSAVIFRDLDAQGEAAPVIRRYLDRAAFKAAQEGSVVVVGRAGHGETVAALLEWAVEGRADSVALAPVSAMLTID